MCCSGGTELIKLLLVLLLWLTPHLRDPQPEGERESIIIIITLTCYSMLL